MTKRRTPRRTTDIPNLLRLSRIHDCYQTTSNCTINKAILYTDETKAMVEKYSLLRSLARRTINAVIPAENSHSGTPQRQQHQRHTTSRLSDNF